MKNLVALALLGLLCMVALLPAFSASVSYPTEIRADSALVPGQNATLQVQLSGPGLVNISSSPAGVVSYQTTIATTQATLSVPVQPNAPLGSVTLVLTSSGSGQVVTHTQVQSQQWGQFP